MPGEDGFALLRKIRMRDEIQGHQTPVVALTAYAGADDVRRMIDAGFWDPVHKDWTAIAMGAFDGPTNTKLVRHIFVANKCREGEIRTQADDSFA